MPEFVIFLHRNNPHNDLPPGVIREHCRHLNRLADEGGLIAAGPFNDGRGGLVAGWFESEFNAHRFVYSDPFVQDGTHRPEVRAWRWSRPENGHLGTLPPRPGTAPGLLDTLRLRATVRRFHNETLCEQTAQALMETAVTAPSEFNLQPWRSVVCRTSDARSRLHECCYKQSHVASAALAVICAVDASAFHDDAPRAVDEMIAAGRMNAADRDSQIDFIRSCYRDSKAVTTSAIRNGAIFGHHLLIAALSMGYAGFWLGGFDATRLRRAFSLPEHFIIAGIIGIGRPAERTRPMPRKAHSEITRYA